MPPWLYLLTLALPGALISEWLHASPLLTFILAALGVIPLAGMIGDATEALSERVGPMVGGLLNATFGNAAEFIIGVSALAAGLPDVVRAAIAGGIIGNALFTLGSAMLAGGWRFGVQRFQARNAGQYALMLALAVVGLAVPSLLATVGAGVTSGTNAVHGLALHEMSLIVAPLLLLSYVGYLAFSVFGVRAERRQLGGETSRAGRKDEDQEGERDDGEIEAPLQAGAERQAERAEEPALSHAEERRGVAGMIERWRRASPLFDVLTLVVATALITVDSELLTGTIEPLSKDLHLSTFFVGLIVLPLVGGAAEFATAMRTAITDHMEATLSVTAGSSIQIALLIAPLLILVSPFVGPTLDLDFSQLELVIFGLVAGLFALISLDGESTWLEGLQLCVFYLIVAVGAFFIPG